MSPRPPRTTVAFKAAIRAEPFSDREKRVPAKGYPAGRGLVVSLAFDWDGKQVGPQWRVSHIRSGRGMGYFNKRGSAMRAAKLLLPLTDWTRTAAQLRRTRGLSAKVTEIVSGVRLPSQRETRE